VHHGAVQAWSPDKGRCRGGVVSGGCRYDGRGWVVGADGSGLGGGQGDCGQQHRYHNNLHNGRILLIIISIFVFW